MAPDEDASGPVCPMCGRALEGLAAGPRGQIVCPACGEVLAARVVTPSEDPDEWAVEAIRPGGISLTIIGALMFAFAVASAVVPVSTEEMVIAAIAPSVQLAASLVVIAGGVQMIRHRSWGLAFVAAVVALLPLGLCCFFTFPAPIAILVILTNPKAKQAFRGWV